MTTSSVSLFDELAAAEERAEHGQILEAREAVDVLAHVIGD